MSTAASATLPGRINTATRSQHTHLNRLLMQRLPLALPPHTKSPLLFGKGIVPFARLFTLFEIEWELLNRQFQRDPKRFSGHEYEVRRWLATLQPPGLARSHRLKNDLRHLRMVGGSTIYDTVALGDDFTNKMRELVRRKPHILIAFAWVFYMAVFSGGRWVRQQLARSGVEFWMQQKNSVQVGDDHQAPVLDLPGISFLSFDGGHDGEDAKALFKARLADSDGLLNEQEQQDVIDVAGQLFDRCIGLVDDLDRMASRQNLMRWMPVILRSTALLIVVIGVLIQFRHLFLPQVQ